MSFEAGSINSTADILAIEKERRDRVVAQNGNDGLHYGKTPEHYSNEKGSLYKIGLERGWNPYQFDAIKRIDRAYKKGQFHEDIEKTQLVLNLMKKGQ